MESVDGVGSYVYPQHQSTRWNPTSEQVRILKELYYRNGIRSPSAEQIQRISWKLRRYGKIEGKNVFYWFQNHKARERQKKRLCTSMVENPVSFDMGRSIPFNFGIKPMERRCSCLEECSETAKGCTKRVYEPTFREECVANYSMSPLEQNYLLDGKLCQELRHHVEILRKTVSMESCEQSREEYWSDRYLQGLVKENRHLKTLQLFPTNREDGSLKSDNENICGSSDMGRENVSTWGAVYEHIREREALDLRLNTFNEVVDGDELV